jgi:isoleucyl-tRNA synthetase
MPFAQSHYPFENNSLFKDGRFPADYICEAVDQTRGWFYSLHAESTLLFAQPCYRNVICLGLILDAKGEKMSKARGNVVEPWAVINKYGADALRWYCFTAAPPGNVRRFSVAMIADITRRFLLTLWNVYSFFVTYANIDHFAPGVGSALETESPLDRWIISGLNQLISEVDKNLDGYDPTGAGRKIEAFVDDLSNWYVRRSRRRFWKSENDSDKLSAYNTLYQCLTTLTRLLAPFMPFTSEELYRNLVASVSPEAPQSVHLTDFPVADTNKIDSQLMSDTRLAMKIASLGRAARAQAGIKVRQPLAVCYIAPNHPKDPARAQQMRRSLERMAAPVKDELNVKRLEFVGDVSQLAAPDVTRAADEEFTIAIPTEISPELLAEGLAREIVRRIQTMRRSAGFDIADHIVTYIQGDEPAHRVLADFGSYIKQETLSREIIEGVPPADAHTQNFRLEGYDMQLGVKKLA